MKTSVTFFLENFDAEAKKKAEEKQMLSPEEVANLASQLPDEETLKESLPLIKEKHDEYMSQAKACKDKIALFKDSQALWENMGEQLQEVLAKCLKNINLSALKQGGITLATRERTALKVDEEWLTGLYSQAVDSLRAALPPYIKIKVSVDKTELQKTLKNDTSLLIDHPDRVYTQKSSSTTIK